MKSATWRTQLNVLSLQDQFGPKGGAASHKLRDQKGKNPSLSLLKEEKGAGEGSNKMLLLRL